MAPINHFRDLKIWRETGSLDQLVFDTVLQNIEIDDFALKDHMYMSAGLVMDNIQEVSVRCGNKGFIQFPGFATRSLAEVESQP